MTDDPQKAKTFRIRPDDLLRYVIHYFVRLGCDDESATAVAGVIVAAEIDGAASHGLFRLPGYAASLRSKKINGKPKVEVTRPIPGLLKVDADRGFAANALKVSHKGFLDLVSSQGIAALALKNAYHFSALWVDLEPICNRGFVAFAFTSYLPAVAPAGGKKALFGTNPMAFGWPRETGNPMIFDQASSVVAKGEIMIAAKQGYALPEGTGLDADGVPTTDAAKILEGALLPFGGYKGSSIALMVELLAGPLLGENLSFEAAAEDNRDGGPPRGGELIIAVSPKFLNERAAIDGERLFQAILSQDGARIPADRRYRNRLVSQQSGVLIDHSIADNLDIPASDRGA